MRQSLGYSWFGTGGNSKKQRGGNLESKRNEEKTEESCITKLPSLGNEGLTTWDAYIKSPKSVHPEDRRLEHLSTVFCPPLVEGWPWGVNIPPLGLHVHGSWTGYRGIRGSPGEENRKTHRAHMKPGMISTRWEWTYMQLSTATVAKNRGRLRRDDMRSQRHLLHTSSRTILAKLLMLKEWTCHNCLNFLSCLPSRIWQ